MEAARILVVDDDPALLVSLKTALQLRMPHVAVDTCETGAAAVERLAATDYDAVVTDIKMPGMDGLTLLAESHRLQPQTPTLLITGHGQHDLAVQALRGGAFDFIQKPLDRDYFVASLSRAIRVRQLSRQVEAQKQALEEHAANLERTVEERTQELRRANQAKDDFLAMLAHELRNPLASIRSAAEMMTICDPREPAREEGLQVIVRQAAHMTRLLDDLLDVSRITRNRIVLHKQPIDLGDVLTRAVETVHPAVAQQRHELVVRIPDEPFPLEGDQARLEQVFVNLLTNAVRYTEPGGRIELKARRQNDEAVVQVCDTGVGVAAEMLPRIFEPFVQADSSLGRAQSGLGIGLSLVRSLVEMHGGRVQASSEGVGRGSAFSVYLPLLPQPVVVAPAVNALPEPPSRRILIVDDNVAIAEMTGLLLSKLGHQVVGLAHDGPSAIEAAAMLDPEIVLLDIGMPRMDGYEVARQLRLNANLHRLVLIAVSGYGQEDDRRRSREAGFDDHVVKPVALETLQELLARHGPNSAFAPKAAPNAVDHLVEPSPAKE